MATITGYTAAHMDAIEASVVVDGDVVADHLILTKHDGSTIDAGNVRGATGATGATGSPNPAGTVLMFAGGTVPTGYLLCDGSAVSRTTQATLFAAISTTYGGGDGSTTFNLPDMGSKFPRGNTLATPGGASTHTHPLSDLGAAAFLPSASNRHRRTLVGTSWTETHEQVGNAATSGSTVTTAGAVGLIGATDSASSLPPYQGFKFIIKT